VELGAIGRICKLCSERGMVGSLRSNQDEALGEDMQTFHEKLFKIF
jgi:hypothetical protein